jgi:transcriptional regulator with XRE-family HTH domain
MNNDVNEIKPLSIDAKMTSIRKLLKQIRKSKGITQLQIATLTGLSKQMVSKIECDDGNPTLSTFIKYCDCIGVDIYNLLLNEFLRNES